jgi:hypothetical protein
MQKLAKLTLPVSLFLFLGAVGLVSCAPENREGVVETQFASYWYQAAKQVWSSSAG